MRSHQNSHQLGITALLVLVLTTSALLVLQERKSVAESNAAIEALSGLALEISRVTKQHEFVMRTMIHKPTEKASAANILPVKQSIQPKKIHENTMVSYVFVAGVEGTGHHWYKSLFEVCGPDCKPTKVGPFAWQQASAIFLSRMDTETTARRLAASAAEAELAQPSPPLLYALNVLGGLNDEAMNAIKRTGSPLAWSQGEGMMSYPNWWNSPNKALQMPDITKIASALDTASTESIKKPQLKVILTTRNPYAIVKSVCEKRNFGREAGGCATEVAMLVLGANALTAQIQTLPPSPKARCLHFNLDSMQQAETQAIDSLGRFLGFASSPQKLQHFRSLVALVNKKGKHSSTPANAGRTLRASWRDALVEHLSQAQTSLIKACERHATHS